MMMLLHTWYMFFWVVSDCSYVKLMQVVFVVFDGVLCVFVSSIFFFIDPRFNLKSRIVTCR